VSYRIDQDFEYLGNDWWKWSVSIDASDAELDRVREVVWLLHPSFKNAREVCSERSNRFRLESSGWGTFLLRAQVVLQDGETVALRHNLRLEYPDRTEAEPEKGEAPHKAERRLKVFLSYGQQDERPASRLRDGLASAGVEVLDQSRLEPGVPWTEALRQMIVQADAVLGLVGEHDVSPFVIDEWRFAVTSGKPCFALLHKDLADSELPEHVQRVYFDAAHPDPASIASELKRHVGAGT
jgi:hypothetical protein